MTQLNNSLQQQTGSMQTEQFTTTTDQVHAQLNSSLQQQTGSSTTEQY